MHVKLFLQDPASVDLHAVIPVFHSWIRESAVPGMLIDVADYGHMVDGPGVVLIGHDVDYAIDLGGGRAGLLHRRKRGAGDDLKAALHTLLHDACAAAALIEQDPALPGAKFRVDGIEFVFADRLRAPNAEQGCNMIGMGLALLAAQVFRGTEGSVVRDRSDDRACLRMRITRGTGDVAALRDRLDELAAAKA